MRARLQTDAGSILKDTEVDIVSMSDEADLPKAADGTCKPTDQPSYRVRDDEGQTEDVDTRDMTIVR